MLVRATYHQQAGVHDPGEDARAALDIYLMVRDAWEESIGRQRASAGTRIRALKSRGKSK